jgi:hypothetical protein
MRCCNLGEFGNHVILETVGLQNIVNHTISINTFEQIRCLRSSKIVAVYSRATLKAVTIVDLANSSTKSSWWCISNLEEKLVCSFPVLAHCCIDSS